MSLKCMIDKWLHKGQISQEEYDAVIKKLDGHDKQIRADAIEDTELFREIFLEELLEDAFDTEERENIIAICKESWIRFIAELEQMRKGAENEKGNT